jgi:hypothetical protein
MRKARIPPRPPIRLMTPLAWERRGGGDQVRHQRDDRRPKDGHRQEHYHQGGDEEGEEAAQFVHLPVQFRRDHLGGQRDEGEGQDCDGRAGDDVGHPAADTGVGAVADRAHNRLDEEGGDVIQRHNEAGQGGAEAEAEGLHGQFGVKGRVSGLEEDGHVGVVDGPHYTGGEEAEADEEDFLVVQTHGSLLRLEDEGLGDRMPRGESLASPGPSVKWGNCLPKSRFVKNHEGHEGHTKDTEDDFYPLCPS